MAEKPTRDDVLRRMLKTPPTPHDESKLGKRKQPPEAERLLKEAKDAFGRKDPKGR